MESFVVFEQLGEDEILVDSFEWRLHPLYRSLNIRFLSVDNDKEHRHRAGHPDCCGEAVMPSPEIR